ncbi:hypothetical protein VitviT2T_012759 [Vitis vinifera]|uniref:Uncharacterized protein n=2 Tax=Vitis vinifera TaxID=29760 RepID=A0ABY9CEQ7_VITVI|nr:UPF0481 protein At3g47200-like isoform X2 [Vitis vinifera]RVW35964.1 UPF0481 protein [Vitis vinifera]WJZ93855.1 hypothetical protein VitviT2T_012759 [Vitis vinifera]|eukprot:XP_010653939.1 PREDICTED: UPF0481 protein At3g47200-like isoform X2 [Vitis vinifera]
MEIVRKETGQAREGSDHQFAIASKQREKTRIDIVVEDNASSSREKRFKSVMGGPEDSESSQLSETKLPRIPKVPQMLLNTKDFKKQFEPRVVSVGPYHHHKQELKAAEMLKRQMTKQFIRDCSQGIEVLYNKIVSEISELKNCYNKNATKKYNDEDLAWMMLVDGCSLLHYIHCYTTEGKSKDLPFKHQIAAFVQQDLLLLENQLPFRVLELLLESRFKGNEGMEMIEKFIHFTIKGWMPSKVTCDPNEEKPSHLLDLLRRRFLGDQKSCKTESGKGEGWNSYRNVNELKAAGIRFRPAKSGSLRDISFKSYFFCGFLNLPEITIDDSTKARFLNLIAYELCPEVPNDSEVTSYICFLDSLIDEPSDVKELRRQHVLRNFLGSDEEVATLFNEITTDLVPDSEAYKDVKAKIQKHYKNEVSTWMTEGLHSHFSSPWTILAFLGAVLALFFGGLQTYYTVFPRGN